jgi:hypothetical protein
MHISSGAPLSIFRKPNSGVRPTFFFHIPKCAGSSVWESLFDIYGFFNVYCQHRTRACKLFCHVTRPKAQLFGTWGPWISEQISRAT